MPTKTCQGQSQRISFIHIRQTQFFNFVGTDRFGLRGALISSANKSLFLRLRSIPLSTFFSSSAARLLSS